MTSDTTKKIELKNIIPQLLAVAFVIAVIGIALVAFTRAHSPKVYLWAWERPEDFSFLNKSSNVAVVFYAGDVVVKDGKATTTLRRNPLFIPDGIKSFPLIRIDSFDSPDNLIANIDKISDFIVKICSSFKECQIDFEARISEYDFYLKLMDKIRVTLPNKEISVTALASWCDDKSFLDSFPANIAIPMLYRMGKDSDAIKRGEVGSWFLSNSKCSDTIALSTDELDFDHSRYSKGKSIYIFNPESWSEDTYKKVGALIGI